jgi:ppGpp synthetase/RelA/SpoT-type nucleotidyltranferase
MPAPISGNQLKKLTQRLRDGTETPDDLHALADVLLYYRQVLERAHNEVTRLCAEIEHAEPMAPRVKTLKTLMEKLHRQSELRIVVHGTRVDQDEVVARIGAELPDDDRPPKLIDRRADPRSGYRAVHLEVRREGIPIEVQVRTNLQHRWAELFERAADRLGRGLRYNEPQRLTPVAAEFVGALAVAAERIEAVEILVAMTGPDVPEQVRAMRADIERFLQLSADYLEELS